MNKAVLVGRLTRDPDIRWTQGQDQRCVARFTVAVNRRFKQEGQQDADFISCIAFGRTAEFCEKYMRQGMRIALSGRIQTGSYTNRDGQKIYTTDVVVEELEFAENKKAETGSSPAPAPNNTYTEDGFMNIPDGIDEELPFA